MSPSGDTPILFANALALLVPLMAIVHPAALVTHDNDVNGMVRKVAEAGPKASPRDIDDAFDKMINEAAKSAPPRPQSTDPLRWLPKRAIMPEGFDAARKRALAGHVDAMVELSSRYADGFGTAQDPAKAAAWGLEAARTGDRIAMYKYGTIALKGQCMAVDKVEAYRWLTLADRRGLRNPTRLAQATEGLSADQRATIDREIATWQPSPPHPPAIDPS